MSSCSVLVLLYSSIHTTRNYKGTFQLAVSLTIWALVAMVVAFITGTYAVLGGHSPGIAIAACVLGCIFFSVFANSLLSIERKILNAPHFLEDMVRDFKLLTGLAVATCVLGCLFFFALAKSMNIPVAKILVLDVPRIMFRHKFPRSFSFKYMRCILPWDYPHHTFNAI
ncbi:hypothetical protein ACFX13_018499 [Malus domestica]